MNLIPNACQRPQNNPICAAQLAGPGRTDMRQIGGSACGYQQGFALSAL